MRMSITMRMGKSGVGKPENLKEQLASEMLTRFADGIVDGIPYVEGDALDHLLLTENKIWGGEGAQIRHWPFLIPVTNHPGGSMPTPTLSSTSSTISP